MTPHPAASDDSIYRQIVESANQGVWLVDAEGRTTFANDKIANLLGYSAEEMAGLSMFDVLDEPGKVLGAERLARRSRGISEQLDCEMIRKDGTALFVLMSVSPRYSDDGHYQGSTAFISNIGHRRRVDSELRQSEQQLAESQRIARLGSWEWDIQTNHISWSDETYRMFGLQPRELTATLEGYLSHVHPDDVDLVSSHVAAALDGADFGFEHRIVGADGETIWARSRGEVIRDSNGNPVRMRGTVQDISEVRRAQAALHESTARYRLLQVMAVAANASASIDDALGVALHEICAHTGWSAGHAYLASSEAADGLVALPLWNVANARRLATLQTLSANGGSTEIARQVLTSAEPQSEFDLDAGPSSPTVRAAAALGLRAVFAFPVLVEREVAAVLEFFSDAAVPAETEMVETIAQVGTQLARVIERQRASQELAAARDAAMESSRLKSDFLAMMSHEIRTPMNGVIGLTELLLHTELDERQREYAEGVQGAGDSLLGIISDILDFSKIEAGKLELEVVDFDLLAIMEQAADLVAEAARAKGLELLTHCHADVPTRLRGDPARIRQVLINLASNAVKFTESGEVIIRALPAPDSATDRAGVRIEVSDTGTGIEPDDLERLFEPFTQADLSTTRRFGGTGLGLAISHRLVEALQGEIGVDSVVGRGSTFWCVLRLPRQAVATASTEPFHYNGVRALIVDDNAASRSILCEQLGAWRLRPEPALDGRAALKQMRAAVDAGDPYQLVLVDVRMPGRDGIELVDQIGSEPALSGTRLIVLTSAGDDGAHLSRSTVISGWLTKPVRQSTLHKRLMQVLPTVVPTRRGGPPAQARVPAPRAAVESIPAPTAPLLRGHLLVVEDNAVNQLVAQAMLTRLGYGSDVVPDGVAALAAMEATEYTAVLMDCHMPVMDGYATAAEIRLREGTSRHTPIIAMTAGAIADERQRCLDAGMDDYISKPVKTSDLDAVISKWSESAAADIS
ncbi:MAG: response regulator [Mycobacteriales bacterium]